MNSIVPLCFRLTKNGINDKQHLNLSLHFTSKQYCTVKLVRLISNTKFDLITLISICGGTV